ncbi:MAG: helix-turn-helix domain-containing protein [Bacteroidales bacterium]|nr:helix-turn-helix domain-containing protein [Bacteroidales bacterium]
MDKLKKESVALCKQSIGDAPIEIQSSKKGEIFEFKPSSNIVVFVNEGSLQITFGMFEPKVISSGEFFFHPLTNKSMIEVLTDCKATIFRFPWDVVFCEHYPMEELYSLTRNTRIDEVFVLHSNDVIKHYMNTILFYHDAGILCSYFYEAKQKEFLYLLKAFFDTEQLSHFFLPILNNDLAFANQIYQNLSNVRFVKDMVVFFNYSYSGFEKRFRRIFGMSANKWLQQERAKKIYHEINCSTKTILEIGYEFGFTSPSHFNDYCKRMFKQTPGRLRKRGIRAMV